MCINFASEVTHDQSKDDMTFRLRKIVLQLRVKLILRHFWFQNGLEPVDNFSKCAVNRIFCVCFFFFLKKKRTSLNLNFVFVPLSVVRPLAVSPVDVPAPPSRRPGAEINQPTAVEATVSHSLALSLSRTRSRRRCRRCDEDGRQYRE